MTRKGQQDEYSLKIKNQLLMQIDGLKSSQDEWIYIIDDKYKGIIRQSCVKAITNANAYHAT